MVEFSKVKLIIWDLDDTFWKGTLSEGEVTPIPENCELVKELSLRGIVNAVCSKNDFAPAIEKLQDMGVKEYFVFPSIDWTPKGNRIAKMIKDMGLRPVNCLFLDDNVVNLNEAKYYSEDIMTAEPSVLPELITYIKGIEPTDTSLKRLKQYRVLETKQKAKEEAGDNMAFLFASNTQVELHNDCIAVADRLFELVHRTNQLNFTKNRCSREDFDALLVDKEAKCGYATVKDNFGDYGIVGFYAIKEGRCIHFLFSCRTIGQGVEQWVYSSLGCPQLDTVEPVVNHVASEITPPGWINQKQEVQSDLKQEKAYNGKIVFKGPCDLEITSSYLNASNIVKEFTYVGSKKASVEHQNHSQNYLSFPFLSEAERQTLLDECVFNDKDMFATKIYDEDTALVFISTLIEGNIGVYRRKSDGYLIAWGEWTYPLTDEKIWQQYIDHTIYTGENHITKEWLQSFKEKYEYVGRLSPTEVVTNIKNLMQKLPTTTGLCLMLGSETPYEKNEQSSYVGRETYHKELNDMLREMAKSTPRLYLIDFNDYIHSQDDFTDNINHFQRRVYFEAAKAANQIIAQVTGKEAKQKGAIARWLMEKKSKLFKMLANIQILRKIVRLVKSKLK